ncbi:MAG: DUF5716 family protein [Lachnospiraceae bacterium]|nr:DUF5716 family protein [Lachnospiraceae bacterium]
MFLEKAIDEIGKKNKVVIGFDLGNNTSQISLCRIEQSMPDTISLVAGAEEYNIPTVLCRRTLEDEMKNSTQTVRGLWAMGKEALQLYEQKHGVLVEDLLLLAKNGVKVQVGEEEFEAEELLEVFLRKCFGLISSYTRVEDVICIMFTLKDMNAELMKMIKRIVKRIDKGRAQVSFMTHEDCFYQYMIHQPEEMWLHDVLLYEYRVDGIRSFCMRLNRNTRPIVAFMEKEQFPQMKMSEVSNMKAEQKTAFFRQLDDAFLEIAREQCEGKNVTSVFLLGDVFSKEWCRESLRFLCKNRRVFQGNNLFSKGACYGARERVVPSVLSKEYVYLSEEKLKANIGIECNKGSQKGYQPLLDAGTNWFDAKKEMDFILAKHNGVLLTVTPLNGGRQRIAEITLEGLQVRGNRTNRIGLSVYMENADTVAIEIEDKGFGEFFPSTGQRWKESFSIEQISLNS